MIDEPAGLAWIANTGCLELHPHLAIDDVLVDSMRGRSSTWTRVRVNLRHVPEGRRPPGEPPDPDEDLGQHRG